MGVLVHVALGGGVGKAHQSLPDVVEAMRLVLLPGERDAAGVARQLAFGYTGGKETKVF